MLALILVLLLVAILVGLGFLVKALFWIALALFVLWVIGFMARPAGRRWYYW